MILYGSETSNSFAYTFAGLLGLFMGVSILSLIEILYYITLRLACNLNYRRNKRIKARRASSMVDADIPNIKILYPAKSPEKSDEWKNE